MSWNKAIASQNKMPIGSTTPSGKRDINILPVDKQSKYRSLVEATQTAKAGLLAATEEQNDAQAKVHDLQANIRRLAGDQFSRPMVPEDHPTMVEARQQLLRAQSDLEFWKESVHRQQHKAKELRHLLHSATSYLASVPGNIELQPVDIEPPMLKKGETLDSVLKAQRARIDGLHDKRKKTDKAKLPSTHLKSVAKQRIEKMANDCAPNVSALCKNAGPINFSQTDVSLGLAAILPVENAPQIKGFTMGSIDNAIGLIAHLFPNELQAAIDAQIDAVSDDATAMLSQERHFRLQEIADELLQAERVEEAIIVAIEQTGAYCPRRDNIDPRAFLEITGPSPV